MKNPIPLAKPDLTGHELAYVSECITSGWVSSAGRFVTEFEKNFAKFCGTNHGVSCSNGTVALHLALLALGVGKGDEVIVPDLTFAATANAVLYTGATPVLVDSEKDTWCMDPEAVEHAVTSKTKAIIPVHLYGYPCDMGALSLVAKKHDLYIIEDAAEAHGASYRGKKVGSFGDISCFSFYGNKILTTGEGGVCVTKDAGLADKMRVLKDHGMDKKKRYWHNSIGYNYRMTNLQAAVGLAQLERIDEFIEKRKRIASWYTEQLSGITGIGLQAERSWAGPVPWLYSILIEPEFGKSREQVMKKLEKDDGIETRPFFYPLHEMPPYQGLAKGKYSISTMLSRQGMNLPTFTDMTKEDVWRVTESIKFS